MSVTRAGQKLPPTAERVQAKTAPEVNREIHRKTEEHFASAASDPEAMDRRLHELETEWDIERTLQTNYGVITVLGVTLGALVARPWFLFSALASGFMLQHALEGWCPPVPVFRRLGYRTTKEIDQERYALKALRGDFKDLDSQSPGKAFHASAK